MKNAISCPFILWLGAAFVALVLVVTLRPVAAAPLSDRFQIALNDADIQKAKQLADRYLKKQGNQTPDPGGTGDAAAGGGDGEGTDGSSDSSGGNAGEGGDSGTPPDKPADTTPTSGSSSPAEPGDSLDGPAGGDASTPAKKKIDPADLMYAQAHMKLAKRAFTAKNLEKAKAELALIFERVSDFAEARFMRAVIAAKEKEFVEAWRHIEIAQKAAPDNPKIKEFVDRLQKAFPKPDTLPDAAPAARPAPTFAAAMVAHGLEKLFAEKAVSGRLSSVAATDFVEEAGTVKAVLILETSGGLDPVATKAAVGAVMAATVGEPKTASEGKTLEFPIDITGLPRQNPSPKPVPETLSDFLKGVSEETDVAIQDSSESDPDANKQQAGTYTVAAAGIKNLVDFLDKVGPHAIEFSIPRFYATTFGGKSIWKGELKIVFQLP
ncbi:MAG: hypothetical protein OZSIB_3567 [Candidatus Ozemobacter sibiricus]|jgi:hypothetical protein|uniref:Uncharacterized protein n=1 Tax=Candidatus Ozemobacter sibiricus TaxID=2268124 RepID=A0A367ZPM9_9BACT|nr:MAG: hypothetical protein OZSIB_3567 [Candidatus Ozemobacter sibiricus]